MGLYYYLRIIAVMCAHGAEAVTGQMAGPKVKASLAESFTLGVLALLLIWLGVYPDPLMRMLETTAVHLA
jgi:NADH-quinone oxidoreductase subunit N